MAITPIPAYAHAGTHTFVPTEWSNELLTQFDPLLVWASPLVVNHDYEGHITAQGDRVVINGLIRPNVGKYSDVAGMTIEDLKTVEQYLDISQADYVAFYVRDIETVQVAGALASPASLESIRALAASTDTFVGSTIAASATALPQVDVSGLAASVGKGEALLEAIFDMMEKLDTGKVPADRYVVVSPKAKRYLLRAPDIANAAALGEAGATANGVVARLAGFTVVSTTAMPTGVDILAGHRTYTTFASQFTNFRSQPVEKFRRDQIDALHLYGARVLSFPGGKQPTKPDVPVTDSEGLIKAAVKWTT
ncbi:hypothetical protein [Nonomuraea roseoviolacea]|uniref:Phage capsid protein n=1 Tax=Nonomuraea roseoviolacea subsp. carminata TaxID=160689 RepID=A0ABT1KGB1_9ACTN|nr:hypothetical protein [Nonomuraea roseoviolacea]MCP2352692.1 hypothetical protein [Nonomuraea roseoviolacea subsp. carminata]